MFTILLSSCSLFFFPTVQYSAFLLFNLLLSSLSIFFSPPVKIFHYPWPFSSILLLNIFCPPIQSCVSLSNILLYSRPIHCHVSLILLKLHIFIEILTRYWKTLNLFMLNGKSICAGLKRPLCSKTYPTPKNVQLCCYLILNTIFYMIKFLYVCCTWFNFAHLSIICDTENCEI